MSRPLMPTATAVWLIDHTSLTFEQIADFCHLHKLEVESIANDDAAYGIKGFDPIANGQLTLEEIERCQKEPGLKLQIIAQAEQEKPKQRKQPRYTPVSRRRDRPDTIAWLIRNHPEISDGQISKLIGTTKSTIIAVRDRTHWNSGNIKPVDPVSLGLSTQKALDEAVQTAARRLQRREKEKRRMQKRSAKQEKLAQEEQEISEAPIEQSATLDEAEHLFKPAKDLQKENG